MGRERLMDKVYESAVTAVADIPSGSTIVVGGCGLSGIRSVLINGLRLQWLMTWSSCQTMRAWTGVEGLCRWPVAASSPTS